MHNKRIARFYIFVSIEIWNICMGMDPKVVGLGWKEYNVGLGHI